jgi:CMP/dCMP kinase
MPEVLPIITIDGPSASGKGTVASRLARHLGFHFLDSGALYRLTAFAAQEQGIDWDDEVALVNVATQLDVIFSGELILLCGRDVSESIRSEAVGRGASQVAALPLVRTALLQRQRDFAQPPGLVADGRDMGSVVFPQAGLKIYLTASAAVRAQRRVLQLQARGPSPPCSRLPMPICYAQTS